MKNKSILHLLMGCLALLTACKDNKDALIYQKNDDKGMAVLRNSILEITDTPMAKIQIYLSKSTGSVPYLYKVETDEKGMYTLPYLPDGQGIHIVGEYTGADKIKYAGSRPKETMAQTLVLEPNYTGGKLKVTFLQPLSTNVDQGDANSRVNAAEVYLFTSKEQAQSLLSAATPAGQFQKKNTNERGIAFFYDLVKYTYYLVGKTTDAKGKAIYSAIKPVTITDQTDGSAVQPEPIFARINRTLIVNVKDGTKLVTGAEVYLFKDNSQTASLSNKNGPFGVEKMATAGINGQVKFEELTESSYYVGVRYKRSDGQILPPPAATKVDLTTAETSIDRSITITGTPFTVYVTSGSNPSEPVYNATVYVFTSQKQAATLMTDPVGYYRQATTDETGKATFADIFSGTYYIGASMPTTGGKSLPKLNQNSIDASNPVSAEINFP